MEETQVRTDQSAEPEGHAEAMAQVAATGEVPAEGQNDDGLILGKFKTQDDLVKAYTELQREFTKYRMNPPQTDDTSTGDGEGEESGSADTLDIPEGSNEESGEDWTEAYTQEFLETGELSEESIEKIAKERNLPRAMIEAYVEGLKSQRDTTVTTVKEAAFGVTGGEENYATLVQWAAQNLSEADQQAYNEAVNQADPAKVRLAVEGLQARRAAAVGTESNLVGGKGSPAPEAYGSRAEMVRDMSNPLYDTDPAFRKQVEEKIANSKGLFS